MSSENSHKNTKLDVSKTLEHLFRHEVGYLTANLIKTFGFQNMDLCQDVVQDTLYLALERWKFSGVPENPSGWFYTVARNKARDILRRRKSFSEIEEKLSKEKHYGDMAEIHLQKELKDETLGLMFACCDPSLNEEMQISLILKFACGFSDLEIARAFLIEEASVRKRISRAKKMVERSRFQVGVSLNHATPEQWAGVYKSLYLLFNEGYFSLTNDKVIRKDLCEEAIRLTDMLLENEMGRHPTTYAIGALFYFHHSRLESRFSDDGKIVLLKEQSRESWNDTDITKAFSYLEKSGQGQVISRYHLESGIAAHHAMAPSFEEINWTEILNLYNKLRQMHPSPLVELNRSIVIWQLEGPDKALAVLHSEVSTEVLSSSPYYLSALAEFHSSAGRLDKATEYLKKAKVQASVPMLKDLLQIKLDKLSAKKV